MRLLRFSLLVTLLLSPATVLASGFGWYVASLQWTDFQRARPEIDNAVSDLVKSKGMTLEVARYSALFQALDVDKGASSPVPLIDESPAELEFYWPDAFRYAAQLQQQQGITSFFRLFSRGRALWTLSDAEACSELFYCYDSYVILSPDEVKAFRDEVTALNSNTQHPADYVDYLTHLEGLLLKTSAKGKGLFFQGHD